MTAEKHIKIGRLTALFSFLLGTLIFVMYYLYGEFQLLFVGYWFILIAGFINAVILISFLVRTIEDKENKKRLKYTCGLMLLNIPIILVYSWATMILLNTIRITFTNKKPAVITNIKIVGCGGGYLEKLEIGESEAVWVDINGDCSVYVEYKENGKVKRETVAGYVTSNMGRKIKHDIDGKDKDMF